MRSIHPPRRALAALAALLTLAACDREITREEARASGPSLVDGYSPSIGVGPFRVEAINERGDIVGNGASGPYRWTRDGGLEVLSGMGMPADVRDVNNAGVAVGSILVDRSSSDYRAVIWGLDGQPQLLPVPQSWRRMRGIAINDAGVVAGTVMVSAPGGGERSFRWTAAGGMELLPRTLHFEALGTAANYTDGVVGINAAGDVLGTAQEWCYFEGGWPWMYCIHEGTWYSAHVWPASGGVRGLYHGDDVTVNDLNDAGVVAGCSDGVSKVWEGRGVREVAVSGCATAVNNDGVVVGYAEAGAFRWTAAGGRVDLGTLNGYGSYAADVNGHGDVAGWFYMSAGVWRAFTWTEAGGMQALSIPSGSTRTAAMVINDAGEVGGMSLAKFGNTSTYTAVRWSDTMVNHPPFAHLDGPYRGRISGRRYAYSAAGSARSDTAGARYSWDMNADGRFEAVTSSPVFNHTYPSAGTYTIRMVMRDGAGRVDTATTSAEVPANAAPVAAITGVPSYSAEGVLHHAAASVTDANQSADTSELRLMRYRWEWGDGSVSATKSASHRYADQGSYTIRLIVTDAGGLADTVVRTLPVGNVAPTAKLTSPTSIGEGTPFTLTASALSDAAADVAAGLQVAFNCGGGFGAYGTALSIVCPARAEGSVTVGMRVRDKDAGGSGTTRTIPVGNVAPRVTAEASSPTTFAAGGSLSVRATFTDVAADAPWRYRIYWGDGAYTVLTNVAAGATITGSHAYARPGSYQPYVAVVDKDGGSGRSAAITVTVTP
jgi:probable HAF family extracellular repeat protein